MQTRTVSVMLFVFLASCVFAFSCVEDDVEIDFDADVGQEQIIPGCVRFVDQDAEPDGDARSWETAARSLEEAVDRIPEEEDSAECEIWVKEGMEFPEEIEVVDGVGELDDVQIYTGFRGNEKSRVVPSRENGHSSSLGSRLETEINNSTTTNLQNAVTQNSYGIIPEPETVAPDDIFDDAIPTAFHEAGFITIYNTISPYLALDPTSGSTWRIRNYMGELQFIQGVSGWPTRMMFDNGNVGIGTTAPTSRLELNGNDNNGSTGTLEIVSGGQRLLLDGNEIDTVGSGTGNLYFNVNSHNKTCINTSGGKVAIGSTTTMTNSVLSITGETTIFGSLGGNTHFSYGANDYNYLTFGDDGKTVFRTYNGSSYDWIGYWDEDGLNVDGRLRAEEVLVEMWTPDYVFGENYDLMTLDEVEKYIDENSHLPGMPSAADVDEFGVSLGDHQARLLQKIEELTLHSIEQNKRIDEQEKTIESLSHLVNNLVENSASQ